MLKKWSSRSWFYPLSLTITIWLIFISQVKAQNNNINANFSLNTLWMLIAACLVFFMNAGFAMLETGSCRRHNSVNVLAKNLLVFCVSALAFWLLGFGLMFSNSNNGFLSLGSFFTHIIFPTPDNPLAFPAEFSNLQQDWSNHSFAALFFWQLVFAGTSATIISGAVAERIKFIAFILFSFIFVGFLYPLVGHWVWNSHGWLNNPVFNFHDFAGSTVVHSVGGMSALVGARLLGPRIGRYTSTNSSSFTSDNLSLSTLGCLILWLGWFGFNGGSAQELANVPHIILTTMISAATGGLAVLCWSGLFAKPNLLSIINGILGGLVAITASSAFVELEDAFVIGAVSGIVILVGESVLQITQTDDPVGAIPVHLFCGLWGTIAVGLFATPSSPEFFYQYGWFQQTFNQLIGWLIICTVIGVLSWISWILIGIILYYLNPDYYLEHLPPNEYLNVNNNREIQQIVNFIPESNSPPRNRQALSDHNFNLGRFILEHIEIGRKGIRVSPDDEQRGSDGFFQL